MNEFLTKRVVKATFDATGGKAIATYPLGIIIPKGAVITNAYYVVRTTFTTANDSGTIALQAVSAGDLKVGIAISDGSNVWDAGVRGCLPGSYVNRTVAGDTALLDTASKASSYILTTAAVTPALVVAVQDLTAGVLDLYIEYVTNA